MKIHFDSNRSYKVMTIRKRSFAKQDHELTPREQAAFQRLQKEIPHYATAVQLLGFPPKYLNESPLSPNNLVINTWKQYLDAFSHLPHN